MASTAPAAAAAAATATTAAASLECEAQVLEALMYRNRNQHGRAGYWKRLQVRAGDDINSYRLIDGSILYG